MLKIEKRLCYSQEWDDYSPRLTVNDEIDIELGVHGTKEAAIKVLDDAYEVIKHFESLEQVKEHLIV